MLVDVFAEDSKKFDFLNPLEIKLKTWTPEITEDDVDVVETFDSELTSFYREFSQDKKVSIYIGYGYETFDSDRAFELYKMLKSLASYYRVSLGKWSISNDERTIKFFDSDSGVEYQIRIGHERDEYQKAFSEYEVVMYHGHSRHGRGPAFDSFWNYYRMGSQFDTIEVDTRNRYFLNEPIQLSDQFPERPVLFDGKNYSYQYRGGRIDSSYLSDKAYTKNIPGNDADLVKTEFLPGKQIFYFYSCKNRKYWRDSLRRLFSDQKEKFVFGTKKDGYGSNKPNAVMIMSIVRSVSESWKIVDDLNETGDCDNCFTAY